MIFLILTPIISEAAIEGYELIIILTKGYGTGALKEEVYVYRYSNGLNDVLVENPIAIIYKYVKTKLTSNCPSPSQHIIKIV